MFMYRWHACLSLFFTFFKFRSVSLLEVYRYCKLVFGVPLLVSVCEQLCNF